MTRGKCIQYAILFVLSVLAPVFLRSNYLRELLVMSCIFAILALSLDIITGYMGQLSFGHAAFFGLGGYAAALVPLRLGMSCWLGFLVAIVLAAFFGFLIGYISLKRTRGMYLAIVTYGFGWVLIIIATNWFSLTRGTSGLYNIPWPVIAVPYLPKIVLYSNISYYYFVLTLLILVMYLINRLLRTRFGRALITLRESEDLARSVGINPLKYYILAFTLATALAGLAGAAYAYHIRIVVPSLLGMHYMFIMLIMVLVGGMGTIGGPVIGSIIYIWGSELLRFSGAIRFFIFGAIMIMFIIFMPRGVYPKLESLGAHLGRLFSRKTRL